MQDIAGSSKRDIRFDIGQVKNIINSLETLKRIEDIEPDFRDTLNQAIIPLRMWLLRQRPEIEGE